MKAAYGYDAYGNSNLSLTKTAAGFAAGTNAYRYDGRRSDSGSGTVDFGARRYAPSTGRFIQRDSYFGALGNLGLSSDPLTGNRYSFAGGNPVNFVEQDGHRPSVEGDEYATWSFGGHTLVTTSQGTALAALDAGSAGGDRTTASADGSSSGCDVAAGDITCNLFDLANAPWQARESWVANLEQNNDLGDWFDVFIGILDYFSRSKVFSNSRRMKVADGMVLLEVEQGLVAAKSGRSGNAWGSFFDAYYGLGQSAASDSQLKRLWGTAEQQGVNAGERLVNGYDGRGIAPASKTEAGLEAMFLSFGNRYRSAVARDRSVISIPGTGFTWLGDPRKDRVNVEAAALTMEAMFLSPLGGLWSLL